MVQELADAAPVATWTKRQIGIVEYFEAAHRPGGFMLPQFEQTRWIRLPAPSEDFKTGY
jgi:hypothetical protein